MATNIIDNVTAPVTGEMGDASPLSLALTWLVIGVVIDRKFLRDN